jgi:hypothetical protein
MVAVLVGDTGRRLGGPFPQAGIRSTTVPSQETFTEDLLAAKNLFSARHARPRMTFLLPKSSAPGITPLCNALIVATLKTVLTRSFYDIAAGILLLGPKQIERTIVTYVSTGLACSVPQIEILTFALLFYVL